LQPKQYSSSHGLSYHPIICQRLTNFSSQIPSGKAKWKYVASKENKHSELAPHESSHDHTAAASIIIIVFLVYTLVSGYSRGELNQQLVIPLFVPELS
jgi:hypothetical protein